MFWNWAQRLLNLKIVPKLELWVLKFEKPSSNLNLKNQQKNKNLSVKTRTGKEGTRQHWS
jgi:hypothetical protein